MSDWLQHEHRVCKKCGYIRAVTPGFGSNFFNPKPCPTCGEYRWKNRSFTARTVHSGTWYAPWTWRVGQEVKSEYEWEPRS